MNYISFLVLNKNLMTNLKFTPRLYEGSKCLFIFEIYYIRMKYVFQIITYIVQS